MSILMDMVSVEQRVRKKGSFFERVSLNHRLFFSLVFARGFTLTSTLKQFISFQNPRGNFNGFPVLNKP